MLVLDTEAERVGLGDTLCREVVVRERVKTADWEEVEEGVGLAPEGVGDALGEGERE